MAVYTPVSAEEMAALLSRYDVGTLVSAKGIAEGVENNSELAMLRAEGCDYFQGYLRSPPLNAEAFERFAMLAD